MSYFNFIKCAKMKPKQRQHYYYTIRHDPFVVSMEKDTKRECERTTRVCWWIRFYVAKLYGKINQ